MGDRLPEDITAVQMQPVQPQAAGHVVFGALARSTAPRQLLKVSEWADRFRILSTKGSAVAGQWVTARNELLREPMDCFSIGSTVRECALMFPIQLGKTEVALNVVGYTMTEDPCPIMVALPGEVSLNKWVAQKLQPMIDESPAVKASLTSVASREAANTRTFKDFAGGQLYLEHAGSPARLKSTTVRRMITDELDEVAANFPTGDDPGAMLDGRTSGYPSTYQRLYISSPQIKGVSRIEAKWLISDQRRRFLPCPHCGHFQHLQWAGLKWATHRHPELGRRAWYVCQECGAEIEEHHKNDMLAKGKWVATAPAGRIRGYHTNCLYYAIGLGPRWADLVEMWLDAQSDPAKLKVFTNDRLAETWEDETTRRVKHDAIKDRAETYALRTAPDGVLWITAGVDTQDNRLAVQLVGWGRKQAFWVLDYIEIYGDPAGDEVWHALTHLLTQRVQHASSGWLEIDATSQDAAGHKTEEVKNYHRQARRHGVRRPLCIFGAVPNNAPVLSKGQQVDVTWRGKTDRHGIQIHHVGTVAVKKWLFGRLSLDAKRDEEHLQALQTEEAAARAAGRATKSMPALERQCHFSAELPDMYFPGLVSETFDPVKNRYVKRRGVRNEPLDTFVYAFSATYHPELRLHRATEADCARREAELRARAANAVDATVLAESPAQTSAPTPSTAKPDAPNPTTTATSTAANPQAALAALLRARRSARHGR
jgi:phage terminase large subunit GpA-like protein